MPAKIYKVDGKRVPSVTKIISKYQNANGLIHWAWKEGRDGRDYRDTRNKAASTGTYVHEAVEASIKGLPYDIDSIPFSPDEREAVTNGIEGFNEWRDMVRFELIESELELTSAIHLYGGTLDIVGRSKDKWAVADLKTGKSHEKHLYQGAAYMNLWNENNPDKKVDRLFLLMVDKQTGGFKWHYHSAQEMRDALKVFLGLRSIYETGQRVEKYV
jgi:hypothetical protein